MIYIYYNLIHPLSTINHQFDFNQRKVNSFALLISTFIANYKLPHTLHIIID